MYYFIQILIVCILTYYFVKKNKPNIKFLFLGIGFFFLTLIFQIPLRFIEINLLKYFNSSLVIPTIILIFLSTLISESTKYFSLNKYLKTKSYKNAILFVIGWISLESINIFSIYFYSIFFGFFGIEFDVNLFLQNYNLLNFVFFFILNLALSVFIILAVIKKKHFYFIFSVLLGFLVSLSLINLNGIEKYFFMFLVFIYSLYVIFKYNKLK